MGSSATNVGDRLGPYRVIRRLGAGGMGVVYHVVDEQRGANLALKLLPRVTSKALYRFKNEFRRASDLAHRNLVRLYELNTVDDAWFFTMELIDGVDFQAYVEQVWEEAGGSVAVVAERLRPILRQLAEGIAALHATGLLHLDLKPTNVLVERGGRVVVLDFGLSQPSTPDPETAGNQELAATPQFLSPEQVAGKLPTRASDWYAAGLMLFVALKREFPFRGSVWESLFARTQQPAPRLAATLPDIPPDLDALCALLLEREPESRLSGEEVLQRLGAPVPQGVARAPLIGREAQLESLLKLYREASTQAPTYVHLRGLSGVGKSALVRHFLEALRTDGAPLVFLGRCYEWEAVPYKGFDPIIDSLMKHLDGLPVREQRELLDEDAHLIARLFPVLRGSKALREPQVSPGELPEAVELRRRAFLALKRILGRLCERGRVVVVLDDLQWGDADSAALLMELLAAPAPPLFVLAAYRSDEAAQSPFFREIALRQDAQAPVCRAVEVELTPLSAEDSVRLATTLHGGQGLDPEQGRRIARESGGNPLFIEQLSRPEAGVEVGTGATQLSLRQVVQARVGQLPEDCRRILAVLAVAGRPITQETALQATVGGSEEPLGALAQLRAAHLIRTRGARTVDTLETYHDRIRESVVAGLPPAELREVHAALARVFVEKGEAELEVLAHHFLHAGEVSRAAGYTFLAAERADAALAFEHAAELYGQCLSWEADADRRQLLRVRRARALVNAGRCVQAAPLFLEAMEGSDVHERRALHWQAIEAYLVAGHIDEGVSAARSLLRELGASYPESSAGAIASVLGRLVQLQLRGIQFQTREESSIPPERLARIDLDWALGKGLTFVMPPRGMSFMFRSLLEAVKVGEPRRVARGLAFIGAGFCMGTGWIARQGEAYLVRAEALAVEDGGPYLRGMVLVWRAYTQLFVGRWRAAYEQGERGLQLLTQCAGVHWENTVGAMVVLLGLDAMGRRPEVELRASRFLREASERGDLYAQVVFTQFLADCRISSGDTADARHRARWVVERWTRSGYTVQQLYSMRIEAYCDLYEGRPDLAAERLFKDWPTIERNRDLWVPMSRIDILLLRARIELAIAEARGDEARLQSCEKTARRLFEEPMRLEGKAHAALIRAGIAACQAKRGEALAHLDTSIAEYTRLDMELHAMCARRRRGELTGDAGQVAEADAWMKDHGIVDPTAWLKVFAPGFTARATAGS